MLLCREQPHRPHCDRPLTGEPVRRWLARYPTRLLGAPKGSVDNAIVNPVTERTSMRKVLIGIMLSSLVACGGSDSPAAPSVVVVGSYALQTYNGSALPAVFLQSASAKFEVLDDSYTLNADHTYTETGHFRTTTASSVSTSVETDAGTYSATNGAITLTSTVGNGPVSATISGNTLTLAVSGGTLVYARN